MRNFILTICILGFLVAGVAATEIHSTRINLPISGNFTIDLYQDELGRTCIDGITQYDGIFYHDYNTGRTYYAVKNGREHKDLYCSGEPYNLATPERIVSWYINQTVRFSPGGEWYEWELAEKNRQIAEEEYARSRPKWDLKCIAEDTDSWSCTMTNVLNGTQVGYKVENITFRYRPFISGVNS